MVLSRLRDRESSRGTCRYETEEGAHEMMRRIGGSKGALAAIASLSLAMTLAFVGAISGCGSSNNSSSNDAGMDGTSIGPGTDSALDSYVADTYVADSYVA